MSKSNLSAKVHPDTVVVHAVGRGKTLPHVSPFVLKLETYLRMANIQYQFDSKKPTGPSGKMPWISLNGKDMADSEVIIEYLNKHFNKSQWPSGATPEQKSLARLIRIALEEHCYWGLVHWRWIEGVQTLDKIQPIPSFKFKLAKLIVPRKIKTTLHHQGIGRLDKAVMVHMISQDIRDLSQLLGNKAYILGDEPCQEDAAIFGLIAQFVWAAPQSPFEKLVNEELPNLKEYCLRIKDKYWEDWDTCLDNGQAKK